jgi:hypothetical protein
MAVLPNPCCVFSLTLITMTLYQRSLRQFEAGSDRPPLIPWESWGQVLPFYVLQQLLFYSKVIGLIPFGFIDLQCTAYGSHGMDS